MYRLISQEPLKIPNRTEIVPKRVQKISELAVATNLHQRYIYSLDIRGQFVGLTFLKNINFP